MNKMQLAHDWFISAVNNGKHVTIEQAWCYADAMQSEAEKREDKTRPEVLEEWQPDWSQAPKSMNYFFMNKDGSKYWTVNKPDKPNLSEHVMDCLECGGDCYAYASSQDYQGNWQDSLRKRP